MKKYHLVFTSNFKNENPYLKEWIDYHLGVGVDHLYLFNQDGSKEADEIVNPYVKRGVVTVHPWTDFPPKYDQATYFFQKNKKHLAYMHAAEHYRHLTQWMLKIDLDEFLYLGDPTRTVKEYLHNINPSEHRSIRVPRFDFGSAGHDIKPEGPVTQNFMKRESTHSNYKDMGNADFLNNNHYCHSSHRWSYQLFPRPGILELTDPEGLRINHYYTKSREEYFERQNISRGRRKSEADFQEIEKRTNQVEDKGMLRFGDLVE